MLSKRTMLEKLLLQRRQIRDFASRPVSGQTLSDLLVAANSAPSVGNSKPWRIVSIDSSAARERLSDIFSRADAQTRLSIPPDKIEAYDRLNVGGFLTAPLQLSFFAAHNPGAGYGQGAVTQPEAFVYSTVLAMHTMWLKASEIGLGFNWCSTLYPLEMEQEFSKSPDWKFVDHVAIGHPANLPSSRPKSEASGFQDAPELQLFSA